MAQKLSEKPAEIPSMDFDRSPFIVLWEVTQACDLACLHCRAEAQSHRHPLELTTEEGLRLVEQVQKFGKPLLVLTGGDPIKRPDILDFIRYGVQLGLRLAMTPSGTPLMTRDVVVSLKEAGLSRLAVSIDGSTPEIHDQFRQVNGSYRWTVDTVKYAHQVGLPVQVNTTMTRYNLDDFEGLIERMVELEIVLWSVFFLVPTGRGKEEDGLTADKYEWVFNRLYDLSKSVPFDIKTTAAPHSRRVVLQRMKAERLSEQTDVSSPSPTSGNRMGNEVAKDRVGRVDRGINDGKGVVFISHTGEVYPSGFLPVSGGNVRNSELVDIYRNSQLFRELREYSQLKGKCGLCEYKNVCGGSRARAYALTGDYMESDPFCAHIPKGAEAYSDCVVR